MNSRRPGMIGRLSMAYEYREKSKDRVNGSLIKLKWPKNKPSDMLMKIKNLEPIKESIWDKTSRALINDNLNQENMHKQ